MTSFADDDALAAFVARDQAFPDFTGETVAEALDHAEFKLSGNRTMDWVAMAARRALAATVRPASETPDRPTNANVRDELKAFAKKTRRAWVALMQRSDSADDRLWNRALRAEPDDAGPSAGEAIGDPVQWKRFQHALAEMDWLGQYLTQTAEEIQVQAPRWGEREWREIRIERAQYLLPIFATAFTPVRITTFTDFYQRMVWLAFEEEDIPDLEGLIREANERHKLTPTVFDPDFIPGVD